MGTTQLPFLCSQEPQPEVVHKAEKVRAENEHVSVRVLPTSNNQREAFSFSENTVRVFMSLTLNTAPEEKYTSYETPTNFATQGQQPKLTKVN